MKQATKAITDILTACGCKPAATVDGDGNTIIKVNAPTVPANNPGTIGDFDDPWIAFFEPD
jgi:hypothetical protein